MSTNLPYGRKKPDTNDDSTLWMSNIEDNISRNDEHNHDGDNSALIDGGSISKASVTNKLVSDWESAGVAGAEYIELSGADIPAVFKTDGVSSSQLTNVVIMDSSSDDERVYLRYTWALTGDDSRLTIYANTKFAVKVLFV